jgi:signal transduction histidine kinase
MATAGEPHAVQRLPLIDGGIVVGSMTVGYPDDRQDPGPERLALVRALAAAAGPIVGRQRDRIGLVPSFGETVGPLPSDGARAERMRIARELHDGLIQSLYGLGLLIRTQAERTDLPERGRQTMSRWVRRIDGLVEEATTYVAGLEARGIGLADLGAGIDAIAEEAAAAGLEVSTEVSSTDDARLSSEVSRELLIVAREAASNAIRHAQAHRLALHVEIDPAADSVTLTVDDDGIGFEPARPSGGHGLDNMAARAAASKGSLDVLSRRGAGTRVRLQMPMQRLHADENPGGK